MPGTKLADLGDTLLSLAVSTITDPPDRQYLAQGEPVFDCSQLTVHLVRLRPRRDRGGSAADKCTLVWVAGFQICLLRCYPTVADDGTLPSGAELHTAGMDLARDGWDLASGLSGAWAAGAWPTGGRCQQVTWGNLEPFTPPVQGGLTGWRMTVEIEMTGAT